MILLFAAALAAESAAWHAEQARQFLKRGWIDDANAEVEAGLAQELENVELNAICVDIARRQGDIERALRCAARGAAALEGDLDARVALSQMEGWLRNNFGFVEVSGPAGIEAVKAPLVSTSLLLDTELQAAVATADARARAGLPLPTRLALPAGEYTLHGEPFSVQAGGTGQVVLPASRFGAAAARGKRLDLGLGASGFSGSDLANLRPGFDAELGFSGPVGGARIAAAGTWSLRGYSGVGFANEVSPYTFGGVVRVSRPIDLGGAMVFVPGVGVAGAMLTGIELRCAYGESPLRCSPGPAGDDQLPVYATAFAVTPSASVAVELNIGRLVLGVRGGIGHSFVVLPSPGELSLDGELLQFESDPALLRGGVYSGAATVSYGL